MSGISTHVLDTAAGSPAAGVPVRLETRGPDGAWVLLGDGETDTDGRLSGLSAGDEVRAGAYRLTFDTAAYFRAREVAGFYPRVAVEFVVERVGTRHHVPLLLSPFGYSTYRGS
ncbi:MAG: hydroxyisourate hydrolase [Actinobacteria bacterium]|nr:hydroxyisourate hydrolase [Actinomycetota bacterium]